MLAQLGSVSNFWDNDWRSDLVWGGGRGTPDLAAVRSDNTPQGGMLGVRDTSAVANGRTPCRMEINLSPPHPTPPPPFPQPPNPPGYPAVDVRGIPGREVHNKGLVHVCDPAFG